MNNKCSLWPLEWWFLEFFQFTLPRFIRGITTYGSFSLIQCISKIMRLEHWNDPWSMGCKMNVVFAGVKTAFISSLSNHQVNCQWTVIFWKESFFSWAVGLNSGLKIFSKPCCKQMCCHPGFVVPFIEHRQSRVCIILKGTKIFSMVNEHWLQLKVTSCISP